VIELITAVCLTVSVNVNPLPVKLATSILAESE
jgi:hypothetical protein